MEDNGNGYKIDVEHRLTQLGSDVAWIKQMLTQHISDEEDMMKAVKDQLQKFYWAFAGTLSSVILLLLGVIIKR